MTPEVSVLLESAGKTTVRELRRASVREEIRPGRVLSQLSIDDITGGDVDEPRCVG